LTKEVSELKIDSISYEQTMEELTTNFGSVASNDYYKHGIDPHSKHSLVLKEVEKAPNQIQIGISQYAALRLKTCPKQMWMLRAGLGKSRIIATMAMNILTLGMAKKVYILIPNESLLQRDKTEYADYFTLSNMTEKIEYSSKTKIPIKRNEVAILDEADKFLFEDPGAIATIGEKAPMICLSASLPDMDLNQLEMSVIDKLGLE